MSGPQFLCQPNKNLEKLEMEPLFEHQLQTTESLKEATISSVGSCFVFTNSTKITKLSLKRENLANKNPGFT